MTTPAWADGLLVRWRRAIIVGLHLALIPVGYALAFLLRFDFAVPSAYVDAFVATVPLLLAIRLVSLGVFRLYSGWWRHVSMYDLQAIVKAVTLSSAVFAVVLLALGRLPGVPRSVLLLDWGIALLLFGGLRFGVRWLREGGVGRGWGIEGRRTLIVGAGDAAVNLLRLLRNDRSQRVHPVGLVDDDPNKRGVRLDGVPVLGRTRDIPDLIREHDASLVILAIASPTRAQTREVAEHLHGLGVELKIVPSFQELIEGRARLDQLKTVEPEELLGRSPVVLDLAPVRADLEDAIVLVTGGAGSIGAELARQIAAFRPRQLVLLEQAETPLYYMELELRREWPDLDLIPIVGDVTDEVRLERTFAVHRPEFVFHAAAYKHVPMMEANVTEAVRNNALGTLGLAECASRYGARRFVLISTDKAVRPSSIMGATKRIAERMILELPELARSSTDFRAVRFGNVLGSAGSVIPLFRRQIQAGGPVTVTHPDMTRYFMTITEAVQLVLQAATIPEAAGRVSMLDMGEPVRILDMAENMVRLSGLEPNQDIPIVITGPRPGEKLHEELMTEIERSIPTRVEKIRIVQTTVEDGRAVVLSVDRLVAAVIARDRDHVLEEVCRMVPEGCPPLSDRGRRAMAREAVTPARFASRRPLGTRESAVGG